MDAGQDEVDASDLAMHCVSSIEGAITLARVHRSTKPIEIVQERFVPIV